jgi:hypothetical protein
VPPVTLVAVWPWTNFLECPVCKQKIMLKNEMRKTDYQHPRKKKYKQDTDSRRKAYAKYMKNTYNDANITPFSSVFSLYTIWETCCTCCRIPPNWCMTTSNDVALSCNTRMRSRINLHCVQLCHFTQYFLNCHKLAQDKAQETCDSPSLRRIFIFSHF